MQHDYTVSLGRLGPSTNGKTIFHPNLERDHLTVENNMEMPT